MGENEEVVADRRMRQQRICRLAQDILRSSDMSQTPPRTVVEACFKAAELFNQEMERRMEVAG